MSEPTSIANVKVIRITSSDECREISYSEMLEMLLMDLSLLEEQEFSHWMAQLLGLEYLVSSEVYGHLQQKSDARLKSVNSMRHLLYLLSKHTTLPLAESLINRLYTELVKEGGLSVSDREWVEATSAAVPGICSWLNTASLASVGALLSALEEFGIISMHPEAVDTVAVSAGLLSSVRALFRASEEGEDD
jgi:hypothetical protein